MSNGKTTKAIPYTPEWLTPGFVGDLVAAPVQPARKKKRQRPQREVWLGMGYELARKVKTELGSDWTQPGKFTAALEQACQRYVQKNGRRFKVKSLREGLRRWEDEQKG